MVETGFSSFTLPYGAGLVRTVAVVVRNPNPSTWTARGIELTITLRDAAGQAIPFDDHARVEVIPPGATRAYAHTEEGAGGMAYAVPARVDVEIAPGRYWLRAEDVVPGDVTIGRAAAAPLKPRGFGGAASLQVTCDATSTLAVQPTLFSLVVLYRDAGGKLIGGVRMYATIDRTDFSVAPQAGTRSEVEILNPPPDVPAAVQCFPDFNAPRL